MKILVADDDPTGRHSLTAAITRLGHDVEIAANGHVTCWSGTQKPHFLRDGIARTLRVKQDMVDCIWVVGPGSYVRSDADDCGAAWPAGGGTAAEP